MKVMFKGKEIDLEEPEKAQEDIDLICKDYVPSLEDTVEIGDADLYKIKEEAGDIFEQ